MKLYIYIIIIILFSVSSGQFLKAQDVKELSKKYPISTQGIEFGPNRRIMFFQNNTCMGKQYTWGSYTKGGTTTIKIPDGMWAKIIFGEDDLTSCTKGELQVNVIQFNFVPLNFSGKRTIILIPTTNEFGSKDIQRGFIAFFKYLKEKKIRQPISLLAAYTFAGEDNIEELIRAEELEALPVEGNNSITQRIIGKLDFESTDILSNSSIQILNLTEMYFNKKHIEIEKIIYFSAKRMEPKFSQGQWTNNNSEILRVAPLLLWILRDIKIRIVTDVDCDFWSKRKEFNLPCTVLPMGTEPEKISELLKNVLLN